MRIDASHPSILRAVNPCHDATTYKVLHRRVTRMPEFRSPRHPLRKGESNDTRDPTGTFVAALFPGGNPACRSSIFGEGDSTFFLHIEHLAPARGLTHTTQEPISLRKNVRMRALHLCLSFG